MSTSTEPRDTPTAADRRRILLVDGLLALTVAASSVPSLVVYSTMDTAVGTTTLELPSAWTTMAYSALVCLPLVVRRIWPWPSHLTIVALALVPALIDPFLFADVLPVLVSLFSVVSVVSGWKPTFAAAASATVAMAGPSLYQEASQFAELLTIGGVISTLSYTLTPTMLVVAGAWALRIERRRSEALQQEAIRLALASDARAEAAAATERRRLAAELHDIVAHHVNLMVVQAETGPYVPDQGTARATFATIAGSGRTALGELDRLLGVLRRDGGGVPGAAPMAPLPTLDEIPTLVESATRAGVPIVLDRFEVPSALDPALSATGHRIVQEAVTNVIKHGDHTEAARVSVEHTGAALRIRVTNRTGSGGRVRSPDRDGHGLVSIRSRLEAFGGTLQVDDGAGHFGIDARLPLGPVPAGSTGDPAPLAPARP